MAGASRKRKRSGSAAPAEPARPAAAQSRPAIDQPAAPSEPLAVQPRPAGEPAAAAGADDAMRRGYARGRARDEEIRASLEPLAPGERPRIVTIAAITAFVFALANVGSALTGNDISSASGDPSTATAVTTALLVVAGCGMLARQYWAVLGFEMILGIQIVFFSLYLIGVQRIWDAIIPLVAIGLLGWLFWKLVGAMARLQMPRT